MKNNSGNINACRDFQSAVHLDPQFAIAYGYLATCELNLGENAAAEQHITQAYELRAQADDCDRSRIEAKYHIMVTGNLEKANESYEYYLDQTGTACQSNRSEAHKNLAYNYMSLGQYDRALREMQQYLASSPKDCTALGTLEGIYIALNNLVQGEDVFNVAKPDCPDGSYLHLNRYYLAFLMNDQRAMNTEVRWARGGGRGFEGQLLSYEADTSTYFGQLKAAHRFSDDAIQVATRQQQDQADTQDDIALLMATQALRRGRGWECRSSPEPCGRRVEEKFTKAGQDGCCSPWRVQETAEFQKS